MNWPQEKHIGFNGLKTARFFYVFTWNAVWTTADARIALWRFRASGNPVATDTSAGDDLFQDPPYKRWVVG